MRFDSHVRAVVRACKALSTLSQKSATVAKFGDSRTFLRQSLFSATKLIVAEIGD